MRFLMVSSFYPPHHFGGDATYVRQLSESLEARGHRVDVVYCYDAYKISGGTKKSKLQQTRDAVIIQLKSRFGALSPLVSHVTGRPGLKHSALRDIFARDYDVVHFHNISLIGGPGILSMSKAPVTLFTAHEHWTVCPTHILWKNGSKACDKPTCFSCQIRSGRPPQLWRYTSLLSNSLKNVDLILAPSEFTRTKLTQSNISCPIEVLPHFVPRSFHTLAQPKRVTPRPGFLYVGRVTRSKGVEQLARLFSRRPQYDLKIVGDGGLLRGLKQRYATTPNISFEGHLNQDDLVDLYRQARAVIMPSLAPESFGLVSIEAFAQATPAIVRDVGGAGETVRLSGAGFVFTDDTEALGAIDNLATDSELHERMSGLARSAYLDHYTEDAHLSSYLSQINAISVLGDKRGAVWKRDHA